MGVTDLFELLFFLLPPRRDRFLGKSTPICSDRRWETRSGVKRAGVISRSWARLYCMNTRLDRSPLAITCSRWKPSPCTCKKQVACELNGWHWRLNTQSLVENKMQSSNILIGGGTQKTHQMKGPFMMKQPHQNHSHTIFTSTEKDETQRSSSTPPACQASDPWPYWPTLDSTARVVQKLITSQTSIWLTTWRT